MPFGIEVEAVPTDVQTEFIELQDDLDLKAKLLSKMLLEFCKVFPKNKISKDFKTCSKLICLFRSTYRCEQFFSMMKYHKSKCQNGISDISLHDTLRIAASSMEANITTIMQQKKQFRKLHSVTLAGFPSGIESTEIVLNFKIGFQNLEKVLNFAKVYIRY